MAAFNSLVHKLPKPNMALLRILVQFLIMVVENSEVNKMNMRNVGIVFVPTLNIPAPVFSMFMTDFSGIFDEAPNIEVESESTKESSSSPPHHGNPSKIPVFVSDSQRRPVNHHGPEHSQMRQEKTRSNIGQSIYNNKEENFEKAQEKQPAQSHQLAPTSRLLSPAGNLDDPHLSRAAKRESSLLFMEQMQANPFVPRHSDPGKEGNSIRCTLYCILTNGYYVFSK